MPAWSPEVWDDFTTVGVVLFVAMLIGVALVRGWIVLGRYHQEIVSVKDDEIAQLRIRGVHDATAIDTLSRSMVEKNAAEDATTRILAAFREAVGGQT